MVQPEWTVRTKYELKYYLNKCSMSMHHRLYILLRYHITYFDSESG